MNSLNQAIFKRLARKLLIIGDGYEWNREEVMTRRVDKRYKKNLIVKIGNKGFDQSGNLGITNNISKFGMFIESTDHYPLNREIVIHVSAQDSLYNLKGEVIWNRRLSEKLSSGHLEGLGIKIIEAPAEYLNYVEYLKYETKETERKNPETVT